MKEIPYGWKLSGSVGIAIVWRMVVLNILVGIVVGGLNEAGVVEGEVAPLLIQLVGSIVAIFIAVHWALSTGFGSVKVIFMERVDYEKLKNAGGGPSA